MTQTSLSPETRLESARKAFTEWRATKKGRSPIPKALWTKAVELTADYSVCKVARTLRLNNMALKKRAAPASSSAKPKKTSKSAFVELELSAPPPASECILEFERPGGAKMKISIKGQSTEAIAALGEAFWRYEK